MGLRALWAFFGLISYGKTPFSYVLLFNARDWRSDHAHYDTSTH